MQTASLEKIGAEFPQYERLAKDKSGALGGWVKPQENVFDIIAQNPGLGEHSSAHIPEFVTPSLTELGALTKDETHADKGSGIPSETSHLPVAEFKNYM